MIVHHQVLSFTKHDPTWYGKSTWNIVEPFRPLVYCHAKQLVITVVWPIIINGFTNMSHSPNTNHGESSWASRLTISLMVNQPLTIIKLSFTSQISTFTVRMSNHACWTVQDTTDEGVAIDQAAPLRFQVHPWSLDQALNKGGQWWLIIIISNSSSIMILSDG